MNDHSPDDGPLRELLHEAVSEIEPRPALHTIRSRTAVRQRSRARRTWVWGAGGAVVATAATVLAVTALTGQLATPGSDPGPAASSNDPTAAAVPVYYVADTSRGPRLYREFQPGGPGDDLDQALNAALTGEGLMDPDYRTDWPAGTTLENAALDTASGTIAIQLRNDALDLRERPAGMSPVEAQVAVQQLVFTAQAAVGDPSANIDFTVYAGEAARPPTNDRLLGADLPDPVRRASTDQVFAQVWVIEPSEGKQVTSPFTVSGMAAAVEGTVVWELRQGAEVVRSGFTTAEQGGVRSPYSFEVDAPPGDYTLVVSDTDPSGGEGFAPWKDTKDVTVVE